MGPICDLWIWVCFVVAMGLLVMLCSCIGGGCAAFFILFFFFFVIGDFVWSGLRKKIGDLSFFFFLPTVDWWPVVVVVVVVVAVVALADGRCGRGWCCGYFFG